MKALADIRKLDTENSKMVINLNKHKVDVVSSSFKNPLKTANCKVSGKQTKVFFWNMRSIRPYNHRYKVQLIIYKKM